MVTEDQKKLYFVPCKVVTIYSTVANSYDEAVKNILTQYPLVREYKAIEDNELGDWIKVK